MSGAFQNDAFQLDAFQADEPDDLSGTIPRGSSAVIAVPEGLSATVTVPPRPTAEID